MISDAWIDRSPPAPKQPCVVVAKPPREIIYTDAKVRRDALRAANKCINGPMVGNVGRYGVIHGEVYQGGRCFRCHERKDRKAVAS